MKKILVSVICSMVIVLIVAVTAFNYGMKFAENKRNNFLTIVQDKLNWENVNLAGIKRIDITMLEEDERSYNIPIVEYHKLNTYRVITKRQTQKAISDISVGLSIISSEEKNEIILKLLGFNEKDITSTLANISKLEKVIDNFKMDKVIVQWLDKRLRENLYGKVQTQYGDIIKKYADKHSINKSLLISIAGIESSGNPRAISHAGAQGLMGIMPETQKEIGVQNPYSPEESISGGASYLEWLLKRYEGNIMDAVKAYNFGPGNVDKSKKRGINSANNFYAKKVLALALNLKTLISKT